MDAVTDDEELAAALDDTLAQELTEIEPSAVEETETEAVGEEKNDEEVEAVADDTKDEDGAVVDDGFVVADGFNELLICVETVPVDDEESDLLTIVETVPVVDEETERETVPEEVSEDEMLNIDEAVSSHTHGDNSETNASNTGLSLNIVDATQHTLHKENRCTVAVGRVLKSTNGLGFCIPTVGES